MPTFRVKLTFKFQELIKLAREHNKSELPKMSPREGIAIPPQGTIIKESNYKLKSPYQVP